MKRFLVLFLLVFCIYTYVGVADIYADSYVVQLPELPVYDESMYPYYVIKQWNGARYTLYLYQTPWVMLDNNDIFFYGRYLKYDYTVSESASNNYWYEYDPLYSGYSNDTIVCDKNYNNRAEIGTIVYSNFDIMYGDVLLLGKHEFTTDGFEEIDDSVTLSGIGGFFADLIDNLASWFGTLANNVISLASTISNLFSNLVQNLKEYITDVIDAIVGLPTLIINGLQSILEFLFVPSDNLFVSTKELFEEKFQVFYQIKDFIVDLSNINATDDVPTFKIQYKGVEHSIIDFSMYSEYKTFIHTIIIAFSYFFFGKWLLNKAPVILGGVYSSTDG